MNKVDRVARALEEGFRDRVAASADKPFAETGVAVPHKSIWIYYAEIAIKAVDDAGEAEPEQLKGDIEGLYGRMPPELKKLVRKIVDSPNYDFAAMELLDAFHMEWRK